MPTAAPTTTTTTNRMAFLGTLAIGAAAAVVVLCGQVQGADASPTYAYTTQGLCDGDELGYTTIGDSGGGTSYYTWGQASCNNQGVMFAPPRSEAARVAYKATFSGGSIVDGFIGIKYNASGDEPKYYVVDGRYKDCLYAGYPFGDMTSWWAGGVINQTEGDVTWRSSSFTVVAASTTESNSHCASYICNNNDDCFGNGLSVSGNWSDCSCGGCATGTSGDNCNNFTIGNQSYTVHPTLTYGTVASMRAVCEASGKSLFSNTTDKAGWDLLQTYIPSTFRFYVDLTDIETQLTWKNSGGDVVSTGTTFSSGVYGEWATGGEGTNTAGGRCVDMMGGKLYQSNCTGNRYFMCGAVADPSTSTTTPTTTTPSTTNPTSTTTTSSTTTPTTATTTDNTTTTTAAGNTTVAQSSDSVCILSPWGGVVIGGALMISMAILL